MLTLPPQHAADSCSAVVYLNRAAFQTRAVTVCEVTLSRSLKCESDQKPTPAVPSTRPSCLSGAFRPSQGPSPFSPPTNHWGRGW